MYGIVYRSAYRGGWKIKPRIFRNRETAQEAVDRFNEQGKGEHHIFYFEPPWVK
jgi:hypothetical protein